MNPHRSTEGFSPLTYLNWIQRGGTQDWKHLYQLCSDAEIAWAVARVLPMRDPDLMASASLWKFLLQDLHPELGLEIDLKPQERATGV